MPQFVRAKTCFFGIILCIFILKPRGRLYKVPLLVLKNWIRLLLIAKMSDIFLALIPIFFALHSLPWLICQLFFPWLILICSNVHDNAPYIIYNVPYLGFSLINVPVVVMFLHVWCKSNIKQYEIQEKNIFFQYFFTFTFYIQGISW